MMTNEELLITLGNAPVVFWFCPHESDHKTHVHKQTYGRKIQRRSVEWVHYKGWMMPRCLDCLTVGQPIKVRVSNG